MLCELIALHMLMCAGLALPRSADFVNKSAISLRSSEKGAVVPNCLRGELVLGNCVCDKNWHSSNTVVNGSLMQCDLYECTTRILIYHEQDLSLLELCPESHFQLRTDIHMHRGWTPVLPLFSGSFDGNNHSITNVRLLPAVVNGVALYGLFASLGASASISNLTVHFHTLITSAEHQLRMGLISPNASTAKISRITVFNSLLIDTVKSLTPLSVSAIGLNGSYVEDINVSMSAHISHDGKVEIFGVTDVLALVHGTRRNISVTSSINCDVTNCSFYGVARVVSAPCKDVYTLLRTSILSQQNFIYGLAEEVTASITNVHVALNDVNVHTAPQYVSYISGFARKVNSGAMPSVLRNCSVDISKVKTNTGIVIMASEVLGVTISGLFVEGNNIDCSGDCYGTFASVTGSLLFMIGVELSSVRISTARDFGALSAQVLNSQIHNCYTTMTDGRLSMQNENGCRTSFLVGISRDTEVLYTYISAVGTRIEAAGPLDYGSIVAVSEHKRSLVNRIAHCFAVNTNTQLILQSAQPMGRSTVGVFGGSVISSVDLPRTQTITESWIFATQLVVLPAQHPILFGSFVGLVSCGAEITHSLVHAHITVEAKGQNHDNAIGLFVGQVDSAWASIFYCIANVFISGPTIAENALKLANGAHNSHTNYFVRDYYSSSKTDPYGYDFNGFLNKTAIASLLFGPEHQYSYINESMPLLTKLPNVNIARQFGEEFAVKQAPITPECTGSDCWNYKDIWLVEDGITFRKSQRCFLDNCILCSSDGATCLSCSSGFSVSSGACLKCDDSCTVCTGDKDTCFSCSDEQEYVQNGVCVSCDVANCLLCDAGARSGGLLSTVRRARPTCALCDGGFFLQQGACLGCPSGCLGCTGLQACTACAPSFVLDGGVCVSTCATDSCLSCPGGACVQCVDGYTLTGDECIASPGSTKGNLPAIIACSVIIPILLIVAAVLLAVFLTRRKKAHVPLMLQNSANITELKVPVIYI